MNGIQMTVRWARNAPGHGYEMLCVGAEGQHAFAPIEDGAVQDHLDAGGQVLFVAPGTVIP